MAKSGVGSVRFADPTLRNRAAFARNRGLHEGFCKRAWSVNSLISSYVILSPVNASVRVGAGPPPDGFGEDEVGQSTVRVI